MNNQNKVFFKNGNQLGINSFIIRNCESKKIQKVINLVNNECIRRLKNGPASSTKSNTISLAIESPTYCINYAQWNVDRTVPLRQYFGLNKEGEINKSHDNTVMRWTYGVGSGSTTIGGDLKTTLTKPMTTCMKDLCKLLSNSDMIKCKGAFCKKKVNFNHITVLYYMYDSKTNRKVTLNPHCDIGISASNEFSENNSQAEGTPTVVLCLNKGKPISFYKRYSNGKNFMKQAEFVDKFDMEHGDIFVLHPKDERVIQRRIKIDGNDETYALENDLSQFKHGVEYSDFLDVKKKDEKHNRSLSISVCFRESRICQMVSNEKHITTDDRGIEYDNRKDSQSMNARHYNITKKRKELKKHKNLERIQKKTKDYVK